MRTFFDSSAFAKRYVNEEGSNLVELLCADAAALALSVICVPEIISALNRRVREGVLSRRQYREVKVRLSAEVTDAIVVNLVPAVVAEAVRVLETNAVRTSDALHIACALQWHAELFVSSDDRQLLAAQGVGLSTKKV
ncbi:type II toxin-antitoxin system VapC family toxin [Candidatus Fermentibacteria bacterium]|nr:type II toxin-antitoxin system VapC family toxin [Candidatus Fermentibacteria bacterium]